MNCTQYYICSYDMYVCIYALFSFCCAVAIHVGEGWVSWNLSGKLNLRTGDRIKWLIQTTILGFPSLRNLVKERRDSQRKM